MVQAVVPGYMPRHTVHAQVHALRHTRSVACSRRYMAGGSSTFELPKFWADLAALFLWNLSYQGMYDLSYFLWNPFLHRRIDVAHEAIGAGLRNLAAGLVSPTLPATMKA